MAIAPKLTTGTSIAQAKAIAAAQLQNMSARERLMTLAAVGLVISALIWLVLLAPAIRTLQKAPEQNAAMDTKLERMQRWAEQAEKVKSVSLGDVPERSRVLASIQGSRSSLGEGSVITVNGDRAVVQIGSTGAQALAQWLGQMRVNARVVPVEVKLRRVGRNWTGRLELAGPGLSEGSN